MIYILTSRFYPDISDALESSAEAELRSAGMDFEKIEVRGCVELPLVAQHVIRTKKPDAVIALGVVIQGETDHYEWVWKSCMQGLTQVALAAHVPVVHGILACPTRELAEARQSLGTEYARTALDMVEQLKK